MVAVDNAQLLEQWHLIEARNQSLGLARYDYRDVLSHPFLLNASRRRLGRLLIHGLKAPDFLAPILWRKILGVQKQVIPSVFYHLGLTYLGRERVAGAPPFDPHHADHICQQALATRIDAEHVCWGHPYEHHGLPCRDPLLNRTTPRSCAHHTARVGMMLLLVGKAHRREEFIAAGVSAARALLRYHNWHEYDDGSCTMSYYPQSRDETINIAADTAALLASLPEDQHTDLARNRWNGLVKMIAGEQHDDGSWDYCTRRHYERLGGRPFVDNHHSATNLTALARVLDSPILEPAIVQKARRALVKGLRFYLDAFYAADGSAWYFPNRRRPAGIAGYCEGVSALYACLARSDLLPAELAARAAEMPEKMLARAVKRFLNARTGDVACDRFAGRPYHVQSARFGSAILMQAISDHLSFDDGVAP